jgi:hypothetical protein
MVFLWGNGGINQRYPYLWMVYNVSFWKSIQQIDDLEIALFQETSKMARLIMVHSVRTVGTYTSFTGDYDKP